MYSLKDLNIELIINYLRKSRQDIEREKRTGEDTLSEMRNLMERVLNNYEVPYITREEIGSGDQISTRPVFMEILEELKLGKYQAIAVKEISRMGRGSYSDMGKIYDLIIEKRIYIITPWKIYDPSNPSDLRQIRFEMFMSREEFETTRERLIGARYNYAMQGKWMAGTVPYGYKFNEKTQKLEIIEDEAKIVRLIFNLYAYGLDGKDMGFTAIANYISKNKIPTPKGKSHWQPGVVQRIVLKTVYIGQVQFRTTKRKGSKKIDRPEEEWIVANDAHETIIDEVTWIKAQQRYENRNKVPRNKMDFSPCELASLVTCAKCGRKMIRQYSTQNYKKKDGGYSKYYKEFLWCPIPGCTSVKYRDVEKQILTVLKELKELDNESFKEVIINNISSQQENKIDKDEIIKTITQRKKEFDNRLNFIYEKYESGIYTDEEFLKRKKALEKEISELNDVIKNQSKNQSVKKKEINIDVDKLKEKIITALDLYKKCNDKTIRNNILRSIFEKIELTRLTCGRGRISSTFDITVKLKGDFFDIII